MVNTPLLSPGCGADAPISPPALWRSLVARGGLCGCPGLWITLPCSPCRAAQPAQKQAKTPGCYQAFLPDVNENQLSQQGTRYVIHFISISIFSLTGKRLLVKKFASAWRSSLSRKILRCWMKPSSQASTEWSCQRTRSEGRGLWGVISFNKQGIKPRPVPYFGFCLPPGKGESYGLCFALLCFLTCFWELKPSNDLWINHEPWAIQVWHGGSSAEPRCVLALLLRLGLFWDGGSALCSVHTYFPQPLSATAKAGGSGKNLPSSVFAIPSLKYWPC